VQPLDHVPFDDYHALFGILGPGEGGNDFTGPINLLLGRRENLLAARNLARMD